MVYYRLYMTCGLGPLGPRASILSSLLYIDVIFLGSNSKFELWGQRGNLHIVYCRAFKGWILKHLCVPIHMLPYMSISWINTCVCT